MLREPLSSPGAELVVMPTAPLLTSQNRAITAHFCSLPPLQTGPGLVSLGSAVSLQNTPPGTQ